MTTLRCALSLLLVASPVYAGTVTGTIRGASGLPLKNGTLGFTLQQAGLLAGTGAIVPTTVACYTSRDGSIVGIPDPLTLPNVTIDYGSGNVAAGTYYVAYAFQDSTGRLTLASPELKVQLTSTGSMKITPPSTFPANAMGITIFAGTVSGAETGQGATSGSNQVFDLDETPQTTDFLLPTGNATVCSIAFNDTIVPYSGYDVSMTSASGNAYPGWPQSWQLNGGAAGTVDVSAGAPLWNGVVIYRLLRTGEFAICDTCPKTFEALLTRIHDDARPGDIRKIAGDPLDDVADETRYAIYTFIQQAATPRQLLLQEAIRGLDLNSASIRWQQKAEQLDEEESPIPTSRRLRTRRKSH